MAQDFKKWQKGWHKGARALIKTALNAFHWSGPGMGGLMSTSQQHLSYNQPCVSASILLPHPEMPAVWVTIGAGNEMEVTESPSVALDSWSVAMGVIFFSKYRHNNVYVHNCNHVGTTQVTGVGGFTETSTTNLTRHKDSLLHTHHVSWCNSVSASSARSRCFWNHLKLRPRDLLIASGQSGCSLAAGVQTRSASAESQDEVRHTSPDPSCRWLEKHSVSVDACLGSSSLLTFYLNKSLTSFKTTKQTLCTKVKRHAKCFKRQKSAAQIRIKSSRKTSIWLQRLSSRLNFSLTATESAVLGQTRRSRFSLLTFRFFFFKWKTVLEQQGLIQHSPWGKRDASNTFQEYCVNIFQVFNI